MYKILPAITLFLGTASLAFADSFDYNSAESCQAAMINYSKKAQELMQNQQFGNAAWQGFISMALFFKHFATSESTHITCDSTSCTLTAPASCGFASNTAAAPWSTLIAPMLDKKINTYLNKGQHDPSLNSSTQFVVKCTYPNSGNVNWTKCALKQQ